MFERKFITTGLLFQWDTLSYGLLLVFHDHPVYVG